MLSSIANTATPFLRLGSSVAALLGFSKPIAEDPPMRVVPYGNPYMTNVDGVDAAASLSLTASNGVSHMPGATGTKVDEMSLEYILSKPVYLS